MPTRFKGKFVFLAHPRTGSTATTSALEEAGGRRVGAHHHAFYECKEPCVSTIRNPYDVLATWFTLTPYETMSEFLAKYRHSYFTIDGRMFYFADSCERFLLYDNLQQEFAQLLRDFNIKPVKMKRLNRTPGKKPFPTLFTTETKDIIEERFAKDLELYRRLCADRDVSES